MDGRWLRYGLYGALIGFAIGFVAGYLRARRGNARRNQWANETISVLNRLVQKYARGGVGDDKTAG